MPITRSSNQDRVQDAGADQQRGNPETSPSVGFDQFQGLDVWEAEMDEATTKEYRGLARQRYQAKMKLVRIKRTLINSSLGLAQLNVLSQSLSTIYAEYSQFHSKVIAIIPDEALDGQENEYAAFEKMYNDVSIAVQELLLEAKANAVPPTPQVAPAPQVIIQQQPLTVPIPTFDGSYSAWPKFQAIFQDLMANSRDADAIKLYHLDKALIGEAAGVLDAKILSEGNYQQAWELLKDRFDNKRAIVETHYRGLLSLKTMSSATHRELRDLLNEATHHIEGLRFLKQEIKGTAEHFFVFLIVSALDSSTRQSWETAQKKGELPKYEQTIAFLKSRCQVLENCETAIDIANTNKNPTPKQAQPVKSHAAVSNTSQAETVCEICGGSHRNVQCSALNHLTAAQKNEKIRAAGVCFNCLRKGHWSKDCPSDKTCHKCQRRHHTLLHDDGVLSQEKKPNISLSAETVAIPPPVLAAPSQPTSVQKIPAPMEPSVSTTCSCHFAGPTKTVLLLTAVVHAFDMKNQPHSCRVMLDSGSQVNFVTEEMANRLGLQKHQANVPITGINALQTLARDKVKMNIRSRISSYHASLECLVTPQVTGTIPASKIDASHWEIPNGFILADPKFHIPDKVDLLIGGELFFDILKTSRLYLGDGLPELRDTHLGWIVSGVVREVLTSNSLPQHSNLALVNNIEQKETQHGQPVKKINGQKSTVKLRNTESTINERVDPVVETIVVTNQPKQLPMQPLVTMNPEVARPLDNTNAPPIIALMDLQPLRSSKTGLDDPPDERSVAAVSIKLFQFLSRFRSIRPYPAEWDMRDNFSVQALHSSSELTACGVLIVPWPDETQYPSKALANLRPFCTSGLPRADDLADHSPLLAKVHHNILPDRNLVLPWLVLQDFVKLLQLKHTELMNTDQLKECLPAASEVSSPSYIELNIHYARSFKMKANRFPWRQKLRSKGRYFRGWFPVSTPNLRGTRVKSSEPYAKDACKMLSVECSQPGGVCSVSRRKTDQ